MREKSRAERLVDSYILPPPRAVRSVGTTTEICPYCTRWAGDGTELSLQSDHVQPRSRGGSNHHSNRVPVCHECNSRKGNKPFLIWMMEIGHAP